MKRSVFIEDGSAYAKYASTEKLARQEGYPWYEIDARDV